MTPDTQVQIRFGRLCSLVMAAISYGVQDRECLVPDVAAAKAAEFISVLVKNKEIIPVALPPDEGKSDVTGGWKPSEQP